MGSNSYQYGQWATKMKNPDADLRFMALTDLLNDLASRPAPRLATNGSSGSGKEVSTLGVDEATEHSLTEQVLALINDTNGEVKNLAVKVLAALIKRVSESRIQKILDKLVGYTSNKDEGVRDIASLGLKTVVAGIEPSSPLAKMLCTQLAPKLIGQLNDSTSSPELLIDGLELLTDLLTRFEVLLADQKATQKDILKASTPLLDHSRPAVRKRAVGTLATLAACGDSSTFNTLFTSTLLPGLTNSSAEPLKTSISLLALLARSVPKRTGQKVGQVLALVLDSTQKDLEDEELKEGVMAASEALVLRCPVEMKEGVMLVLAKAVELMAFDPNFAGGDEDDVEMQDDDDDDELEDEEYDQDYSDDDDTSWKVRRSALKVILACITTRPDLLVAYYKSLAPALLSRFGEREETVKVEVWGAYGALLSRTGERGEGGLATAVVGSGNGSGLKRKRSEAGMEVEDEPVVLLRQQASNVARLILKELGATKSLALRQAGFTLLHELILALHGSLEQFLSLLISRAEPILRSSDTGVGGNTTALKISVLQCLRLVFLTHPAKAFSDDLDRVVSLLVETLGDKFNKIAAEAFSALSALITALRPSSASPGPLSGAVAAKIKTLYEATVARLNGNVDEDVRVRGTAALGSLLANTGDALPPTELAKSLDFLRSRLSNEVTRLVTVGAITAVAESPRLEGKIGAEWFEASIVDISVLLRQVHRPLKVAAFGAINTLLRRASAPLKDDTKSALFGDLLPLLSDADVNILPLVLTTLARLLETDGSALSELDEEVMPRIYGLVSSHVLQGAPLDGLLAFISAYVGAGAQPAPLVDQLFETAAEAVGKDDVDATGATAGLVPLATASKCVAAVVKESEYVAESVVKRSKKAIEAKKSTDTQLVLALYTIGEVGRFRDLASDKKLFDAILGLFSASSEEVRRAAAYAAGNMAVANPATLLPPLLDLLHTNEKKKYLAGQAIKEVITHASAEQIGPLADSLWTPLFDNCEEEGLRNLAADCLGQLTVTDPAKYLPQLQSRLTAESPDVRATVIAAIRYTFTNESSAYDDLLTQLIVQFFTLVSDSDLGVRRLALSCLNSAARSKPRLVREHMPTLLASIYSQTVIDVSLIRTVTMGPFKIKVDDGLDIRKTAYETMNTLLDTSFKAIEINQFVSQVLAGLSDDDEVKKLCYLMLARLVDIAPTAVSQKLEETVQPFTEVLNAKLKDSAVKQELEKLSEMQKATVRCVAALYGLGSPTTTPKLHALVQTTVANGPCMQEFREIVSAKRALASQ